MPERKNIIIAAKCAPEYKILSDIKKAGLAAVELYLSEAIMSDLNEIIKICGDFAFRYAIHAPNDCYNHVALAKLADSIGAEIVNFHNIYWEDEWEDITNTFKNIRARPCIENTYSCHESLKFMRRYGLGMCLDLEHLQMECAGVYEEEFVRVMKLASHIHLTGYTYGSKLWHSHIHHSPKHSLYILGLLRQAGYSGFVVSEGKASLQTYKEFNNLNNFSRAFKQK